mgnify:CR=1 FL=1
MNSEKLNAEQILEVASSQWATAKDIMMLGSVGRNKAYAIRSEIALALYSDNTKHRNRGLVPMVEVLKYFDIDLNYLKDSMTNLELALNNLNEITESIEISNIDNDFINNEYKEQILSDIINNKKSDLLDEYKITFKHLN